MFYIVLLFILPFCPYGYDRAIIAYLIWLHSKWYTSTLQHFATGYVWHRINMIYLAALIWYISILGTCYYGKAYMYFTHTFIYYMTKQHKIPLCFWRERTRLQRNITLDKFKWHLYFHQEIPKAVVEGFHGIISFGVIPFGHKIFISLLMHI